MKLKASGKNRGDNISVRVPSVLFRTDRPQRRSNACVSNTVAIARTSMERRIVRNEKPKSRINRAPQYICQVSIAVAQPL